MARTKDRHIISEAIRKQALWRRETYGSVADSTGTYVDLITDYDERLRVQYGRAGQVVVAHYSHWDRDTGRVVSTETITLGKRERVLELINQKDVGDVGDYVGRDGAIYNANGTRKGSIAEALVKRWSN